MAVCRQNKDGHEGNGFAQLGIGSACQCPWHLDHEGDKSWMGKSGSGWLGGIPSVHKGNLSGNFLLEAEMGGFLIPKGEGGWYGVDGLDAMHNPGRNSHREVGDQCGGVFRFIILSADNVQLEHVNVFLELLSGINMSGGQPIHGFLGGVGVNKGIFKISLELSKGSK